MLKLKKIFLQVKKILKFYVNQSFGLDLYNSYATLNLQIGLVDKYFSLCVIISKTFNTLYTISKHEILYIMSSSVHTVFIMFTKE